MGQDPGRICDVSICCLHFPLGYIAHNTQTGRLAQHGTATTPGKSGRHGRGPELWAAQETLQSAINVHAGPGQTARAVWRQSVGGDKR